MQTCSPPHPLTRGEKGTPVSPSLTIKCEITSIDERTLSPGAISSEKNA